MEFTGKLSELDLSDVRKTARSKTYWPKFALANWYGILLLVAVTWGTISGLLGQTKPNWSAIAIIWAIIATIFVWSIYRTKRAQTRAFTQLNMTLPDQVNLTNEGVKLDGPNGATSFLPWRSFKGWREGHRVVLIDQTEGNQFVILPVAQLSEIERQQVRSFLQSQIPPVAPS